MLLDGENVRWPVKAMEPVEAEKPKPKVGKAALRVRAAIGRNGSTANQLQSNTGLAGSTVRKHLAKLRDAGLARSTSNPGPAWTWFQSGTL